MPTLYHVAIRNVKTPLDQKKIDQLTRVFDSLGYWGRLNVFNWYVWSDQCAQQIYMAVSVQFQTEDSIAVFAVRPEMSAGWAPEWFWKFVNGGGGSGPV